VSKIWILRCASDPKLVLQILISGRYVLHILRLVLHILRLVLHILRLVLHILRLVLQKLSSGNTDVKHRI
jgi:hypothetical protein